MASVILQSDDDDDDSLTSTSSSDNKLIREEENVAEKIPLTTSVIMDKLPEKAKKKIIPDIQETVVKISIRFQPIGSAPQMKPNYFKILSNQTVSTIIKFISKKLKLKNGVYLYVQNSFQPTPDEKLGDLYNLFKTNNELVINYCQTVAFG